VSERSEGVSAGGGEVGSEEGDDDDDDIPLDVVCVARFARKGRLASYWLI